MNKFRPIDYLDRIGSPPDKKTQKLLTKYSVKLQRLVARMKKVNLK